MHPSVTSSSSINCSSPLWEANIRDAVKSTQMSQHQLNQERTKLLVPGTQINLGRQESRIPVLLLHNPGVKGQHRQGIMGYGAGWDVVLPAGWAMAFWIALIYRGARVGGIRESRNCALQQGLPHFPEDSIDTDAGKAYAEMHRKELEIIQKRKPPAKRPNYAKLGMPSPFHIEWCKLVEDWRRESKQGGGDSSNKESDVLVVRDRQKLQSLNSTLNDVKNVAKNVKSKEELMKKYNAEVVVTVTSVAGKSQKRPAPALDGYETSPRKKKFKSGDVNSKEHDMDRRDKAAILKTNVKTCNATSDVLVDSKLAKSYVCVQVSLINKGAPGPFSLICLPSTTDLDLLAKNPQYGGPMEPIHKEYVLPRKPNKKTKDGDDKSNKPKEKITTDKLGVPNLEDVNLVRFCTRQVIGYLTNGVHALSVGRGYGVGYCCVLGLRELVKGKPTDRPAVVLVRDTGSLQYRFATIKVQL